MLDPFTAAALISGIPALLQSGTGVGQLIKGNKMAKDNQRPMYEIPQAATEAIGNARAMASSRELPAQSLMEQNLDEIVASQTQDVFNTSTSSSDSLGAILGLNANRLRSQLGLELQGANSYQARQEALRRELKDYAGYQDKKWELNQLQPFQDKAATASALIGGGMENIFGGVNTLAGIGTYGLMAKDAMGNPMSLADGQKSNTALLAQAGTTNNEPSTAAIPKTTQDFIDGLKTFKYGKNPMDWDFMEAPATVNNFAPPVYQPPVFNTGKNPMNWND